MAALSISSLFPDCSCDFSKFKIENSPELFSAINVYGEIVSSLPIHLMQATPGRNVRVDNGLAKVLDIYPNPRQTRADFMYELVYTMLFHGFCIVKPTWKENPNNSDSWDWLDTVSVINPSRTSIQRDLDYRVTIYVDGKPVSNNEYLIFTATNFFGWKSLLKDTAATLYQTLQTHKSMLEFPFPPVIVRVPDYNKLLKSVDGKQKFEEMYLSGWKRGAPLLIPSEVVDVQTIKPTSINDLGLKDSVTIDRQTISGLTGVPDFLLSGAGDFSVLRFNNFVETCIQHVCTVISQEFTRGLIETRSYFFSFNITKLYNYTLQEKVQVIRLMANVGAITPNEIRGAFGYEFLPDPIYDKPIMLENYNQVGVPKDGDDAPAKSSGMKAGESEGGAVGGKENTDSGHRDFGE
jgi:HK97 family phage portal protein